MQYVLSNVEEFQAEAPWDVDVEVDFFHAKPGVTSLVGGPFKGRSLVYTNLKHIVVRVKSASVAGVEKNSILVSSHIDTVISAYVIRHLITILHVIVFSMFQTGLTVSVAFNRPGAGDCNSNIGVMLELVRAISNWAHGFKHSVIFLFNMGEEEGLDGAHGFITQVSPI
jgi:acetylornithine deacetylase/succinyl-diaminopimelate desuccinylase-like protein